MALRLRVQTGASPGDHYVTSFPNLTPINSERSGILGYRHTRDGRGDSVVCTLFIQGTIGHDEMKGLDAAMDYIQINHFSRRTLPSPRRSRPTLDYNPKVTATIPTRTCQPRIILSTSLSGHTAYTGDGNSYGQALDCPSCQIGRIRESRT
jgi:hypothetical protein